MSNVTSYTPEEVAAILKITRFTVYEMIKRGDLAAYRIGRKFRIEAPDVERYIQHGKGQAAGRTAPPPETTVRSADFIICGQDSILDSLTRHLKREMPQVSFLRNYVGSMDGLTALYRGTADAVTAHLWDSDTGSYNIPYVRRLLPGYDTLVINLAYRHIGFYVAAGNPKQIRQWQDLARPDVRFVNRELGSGARVLLDEKLRVCQISRHQITGYQQEEMSHFAVASVVARSEADVGLGTEKTALQVPGLDFILQQKERYDLVIRRDDADKSEFRMLLSVLRSQGFRNEIQGIGGYDLSQTGEIMDT